MRLVGAVTQGSGIHNEDAFGFSGTPEKVTAAWVLDGVTGINATSLLNVPSEPVWFVAEADKHLRSIVEEYGDVRDILSELVRRLYLAWSDATRGILLPEDYDLPAACLTLVKQASGTWQALRLGDSYLLSKNGSQIKNHPHPPSDLALLEVELKEAARTMRSLGLTDLRALQDRFRPRLHANRKNRNSPGSYSILVPDESSLAMPEVLDLLSPEEILLCSDGFYRAVDIYKMMDDTLLFQRSTLPGGIQNILRAIRLVEASDPNCETYLRFKPSDDVTAVMLSAVL